MLLCVQFPILFEVDGDCVCSVKQIGSGLRYWWLLLLIANQPLNYSSQYQRTGYRTAVHLQTRTELLHINTLFSSWVKLLEMLLCGMELQFILEQSVELSGPLTPGWMNAT